MAKKDVKESLARNISDSLKMWNQDQNESWTLGTNYSSIGTEYETYVNKYLYPKLQSTQLINSELGNSFNFLAKETPYVSQLNEEYVILDSKPVDLNLDKEAELMLRRNYPNMATRLYGAGVHKKQKFTLNDNDNRLNWLNLGDAIKYSVAVYRKKLSDINVDEETQIRAMLVDYALNYMNNDQKREVTDIDDLATTIFRTILNIQNNSSKYNEAYRASGGSVGRYTTYTPLQNILILTTDRVKEYLLNTRIANTFQVAGIDFTQRCMSFDNLGGAWKLDQDTIIAPTDIPKFKAISDYQAAPGDPISKGAVFTYDVSSWTTFQNKVTEIKPKNDLFALVLDANSIYYKRNTNKLLPTYFYNNELDEYNYFIHYYSFKAISPFYNKILCYKP